MKEWQAIAVTIVIIVVLVAVSAIAQYKIATSDLDPWIKFWLLSK